MRVSDRIPDSRIPAVFWLMGLPKSMNMEATIEQAEPDKQNKKRAQDT